MSRTRPAESQDDDEFRSVVERGAARGVIRRIPAPERAVILMCVENGASFPPAISRLLERVTPAKLREPREAAIRGDPLAAVLDGERGEIRIGNSVASCAHSCAEINKDLPMSRSRFDGHADVAASQRLDKCRGDIGRRWRQEYSGMREDAKHATENDAGQTNGLAPGEMPLKPLPVVAVTGTVGSRGVHQHIHIDKQHDYDSASIRSRSAAESSRLTPLRSPPPP